MKKKLLICILTAVMMTVVSGCGKEEQAETVFSEENDGTADNEKAGEADYEEQEENLQEDSFEDRVIEWSEAGELKEYIQAATGITDRDIMLSDLKGIEELDLSGVLHWELEELELLPYMTNLKVLTVSSGIYRMDANGEPVEIKWPENLEELNIGSDIAIDGMFSGSVSGLPKLSKLKVWSRDISGISDLPALKELDLSYSMSLSDISRVADFPNLEKLDLTYCGLLDDIEALSELTNLTELNLNTCSGISNIDALSDLVNLKSLNLNGCDIHDIEALSDMVNLTELDLGNCSNLNSIEALSNLANLTELDLSSCSNLNSIEVLSNLTNLKVLYLDAGTLSDLSVLTKLARLEELHLSVDDRFCPADLNVLSSLAGVKTLEFLFSGTIDMNIFSGMTNLEKLDLNIGSLGGWSIRPLAVLPNLTTLHLRDRTYNMDISAVSELSRLEELEISGPVGKENLDFLRGTNLKMLNLYGSTYVLTDNDIAVLSSMGNLRELILDTSGLFDVSDVSGLANLTKLDLSYSDIDTNKLSSLTNLKELNLYGCYGIDISPLSGLTNLEVLNLGSCGLTDVSALSGLTNLEVLNLGSCGLTDVSALSGLKNLKELDLRENYGISDYSPVEFVPELLK